MGGCDTLNSNIPDDDVNNNYNINNTNITNIISLCTFTLPILPAPMSTPAPSQSRVESGRRYIH